MNILREIYHTDLGLNSSAELIRYEIRKAARAVLFDDQGSIALMYVAADDYYKLPGGGLEKGETMMDALHRELLEEVGAKFRIFGEIGAILEYRDCFEQLQISYCYLCRVLGKLVKSKLTKNERDLGFSLVWSEPIQAVNLIRAYSGTKYVARFICARDLTFLEAVSGVVRT